MNQKEVSEARTSVDAILASLMELGYMENLDEEVLAQTQIMSSAAITALEKLNTISPRPGLTTLVKVKGEK